MARTKLVVAFALGSAILSSAAGALGLGAIEIKSALNQPLDAHIPLLPADDRELETLSVRLATVEAFQRAGVDRPFFLTRLKFNVVSGDDPYVRIFTDQPVKEPFLDFLVEADWDRGRLIREFTLLLDPPVFDGAGQVAPRVVAAPAREQDQTVQAASPPSTFAASASAAPAQEPATRTTSQQYGPVSANDTLWRIAQSVRPDPSISMNQMMVAILRANPDAFIGGDMNRLRRGSTLTIPDAATITAISRTAADQEARDQLQRWRQSLATTPAQPSGRLQVVASEQAQPSDSDAQEQPSEQAELDAMRRELTTHRERSLSLEAENEDLKAQVEGLKQELAQLERLISLEADRPAVIAETAQQESEQLPTELAETESEAGQLEPSVEEPVVAEAAEPVAPASLPAAPIEEAPGFLDDPRNLGLLGGLALALLGLIYLLLRRRRAAEPDQPLTDTAVSISLPEADTEPAESVLEEADDAADHDEPLDVMAILPEDSDVLSEADLYLGHGRYGQARELLETALQAEPEQPKLRLKLMEALALLQDQDGFIEHAQVLRGQVGETDSDWLQAQEMGRELLPMEPMFAATATSDLADSVESTEDILEEFELPADESDTLAPVAAATEADEVDESFELDFDLPEDNELAAADEDTEFPIVGDSSLRSESAELDFEQTEAAPLDDVALDLPDLQFDEAALGDDDNVLDFTQPDLAEADTADDEQLEKLEELDEVGVKLNLARAYIDLGDHDGARSLLDEVLAEGSSQQQEEAETLLGQIA